MMIVVIVCRLSAPAELPWISSIHFVISASKQISGEVSFICSYCIFLWPAAYEQLLDGAKVVRWWEVPSGNWLLGFFCHYSPYISSAHLKHGGGLFLVPVNSEECELLIYFAYFISFRTLSLGFLGFLFCKMAALTGCTSSSQPMNVNIFMFILISHLTVKKVVFSSTLHLVQCIKVALAQNKYIMSLMLNMKFRKEPDAKKKGKKGKGRGGKRRN